MLAREVPTGYPHVDCTPPGAVKLPIPQLW